jgi:hypothetical protein
MESDTHRMTCPIQMSKYKKSSLSLSDDDT